ncbi:MAG: SMI1/KNR4 family protein [Cyanobacteria bacterium J06648_10]
MTILGEQISKTLLPGMVIPDELNALFAWIESNGLYIDKDARRIGFLFPEDELKKGLTDTERPGGTNIEFFAEGNFNLHHWFGHERADVLNRLCVFAKTGSEGSMAAFWIDDAGKQRIVHMGSGSGSVLCCVLAETPVDFLRLLAIGYDEICWNDAFPYPPNSPECDSGLHVHPNIKYQDWVRGTFDVSIPERATAIVKHLSEMDDTNSPDRFCRWVEQNAG